MLIIYILIAFFLLLFLGTPVAFTIGLVTVGVLLLNGTSLDLIIQRMFSGVDDFSYLALPLFILAGNIMGKGGLTSRLIRLANVIVGKLSGGLAMTSIVTSALFGAISGSTVATTYAVGSVMVPRMKEQQYSNSFIASIIGPAGVLGLIIPPSITMVILGITADISIGKLFLAGFLPGILLTAIFCLYAGIMSKRKGFGVVGDSNVNFKQFLIIFKEAFLPLMTPVLILVGIFGGFVTATEAAVIAVVYGFILSMFYKELTLSKFKEIMINSATTAATILIIISVANAFTYVLTANGIPTMITDFFLQYANTSTQFLLIVSVILFILGTMTEVTSLIILLGPIFMPIATQYGIDPIHFGMILIMNFALANITPPVGLSLIAGTSITDRNMGIEKTLPYILHVIAILVIFILLIIFIPGISTIVPNLFD